MAGSPQAAVVPDDVDRQFTALVPELDRVPLPGHGSTAERFEFLAALAEDDLSLARLAEGHADALAILDESGTGIRHPGLRYGVWAARSGTGNVVATPVGGGWALSGTKPFCSGSGMIDRALVTAEAPDGYRLFDVATADVVIHADADSWPAVGMADSRSETLTFGGAVIGAEGAVGAPGFYTGRPGFWFGACGVAACWFGGARALAGTVSAAIGGDPGELTLREVGSAAAWVQSAEDSLGAVAGAIDADPGDAGGRAHQRALALRQIVHHCCEAVLQLTAAAGGARPLCHDIRQARRAADLYVYLAQHHGGADAARLGRLVLEGHR